jgi:N-acetyl-anhydromuramyl-L-alanine amidase AmpD
MGTFPFIQARHLTPTNGRSIDLLVIHAMEAIEKPGTAEAVARWFAGPDAPQASAHYCLDNLETFQCVRDQDVAWHAPGANHNGLGFEHAGYSKQSAAEWDDPYSRALLWRSARLLADKCAEYDIPPVWLSPADLLAGKRGITSHWNVSLAFRRSDHTDPGPGFPAQRYVTWVRRVLATRTQAALRY